MVEKEDTATTHEIQFRLIDRRLLAVTQNDNINNCLCTIKERTVNESNDLGPSIFMLRIERLISETGLLLM